jgi:mRNA-degrading endonuclease RelE of RelBE toxin-antitoxin system
MKRILILPSFGRSIKTLTPSEKKQLAMGLNAFKDFVFAGKASFGIRLKKINHDKYEFRVGIRLRVIVKEENDILYLVLVGNHDEVKRYLRNFR